MAIKRIKTPVVQYWKLDKSPFVNSRLNSMTYRFSEDCIENLYLIKLIKTIEDNGFELIKLRV